MCGAGGGGGAAGGGAATGSAGKVAGVFTTNFASHNKPRGALANFHIISDNEHGASASVGTVNMPVARLHSEMRSAMMRSGYGQATPREALSNGKGYVQEFEREAKVPGGGGKKVTVVATVTTQQSGRSPGSSKAKIETRYYKQPD